MIIPHVHFACGNHFYFRSCTRLSRCLLQEELCTSYNGYHGEVTSYYTWTLRAIGWRYGLHAWRIPLEEVREEKSDEVEVGHEVPSRTPTPSYSYPRTAKCALYYPQALLLRWPRYELLVLVVAASQLMCSLASRTFQAADWGLEDPRLSSRAYSGFGDLGRSFFFLFSGIFFSCVINRISHANRWQVEKSFSPSHLTPKKWFFLTL